MFGSLVSRDGVTGRLVRRFRCTAGRLGATGFNLVFPGRCERCEVELDGIDDGVLLCDDCRLLLGPKAWPGCPRCGAADGTNADPDFGCDVCRGKRYWFDRVTPLGGYHQGLRDVVLQMKHAAHDSLSRAMGRLLALRRRGPLTDLRLDLIVPIPMYWSRRVTRGTNSPEILATAIGQSLGVRVDSRVLSRCRNTLLHNELSQQMRFRNVRGAFRLSPGRLEKGSRILLVDDVLTTGATCSEAASVLKKAGAEMVAVAVIARTEGRQAT
ncbi:MAG: ComF family protein [Candidatus Nealsonbacteria bacterium]|nr:ComF family protein [Candidatus Nealsonbacteria bacterium]